MKNKNLYEIKVFGFGNQKEVFYKSGELLENGQDRAIGFEQIQEEISSCNKLLAKLSMEGGKDFKASILCLGRLGGGISHIKVLTSKGGLETCIIINDAIGKENLKVFFEKHCVRVGKSVSLGSGSTIGYHSVIGDGTTLDRVYVSPKVKIGRNNFIEKCKIGDNVTMGDNNIIGESCNLGRNSQIGNNCRFYSNCEVYPDAHVGSGCTLAGGSKIEHNLADYYHLKRWKMDFGLGQWPMTVDYSASCAVDTVWGKFIYCEEGVKILRLNAKN